MHIFLLVHELNLILTKKELGQNQLTITLMLNGFAPRC